MNRTIRDPAQVHRQLVLPLRGRTGCRWVPLLIITLLVSAGGIGASYWIGLWPAGPVLMRPAGEMRIPAQTVAQASTATHSIELPTADASHTPAPSPTVMATSTSEAPLIPTPTATATREATATAVPMVTATPVRLATLTWTPTFTLTPMPTPTLIAPTEAAPPVTACEPALVSTIERALEAQALYMEGSGDTAALAAAWGGAAADAQTQAERMMSYRAADIMGVQVNEVAWALTSCRARAYEGWVQVEVSEEWRYTAQLTCASGKVESSVWSEAFASETYALVRGADGFQIRSWRIEAPETQTRWRCSKSE